jgi:replication initiation and membrane attachment protein DnaB
MFLLSTTRLVKSSTNFVHNLSTFGNELIKHNAREEWDATHEDKIRVLHKVYKQVFNQLYTIIMPKLVEQEWILIKRPLQDNKQVAMS